MNNYTVTFNGDTPEVLFNNIRQFCALLDKGNPPVPQKTESITIPAQVNAAPTVPAPAPIPAAMPTPTYPASMPIPAPISPNPPNAPAQIPTAAAPVYTLEQLGRATCVLSDANRVPEIQELFASFGISALTELAPAQYGAYAAALRQKGVSI